MTLQSDKRAHTASANECSDSPLISRGSTSAGAGTIAARSRAIARRSLRMATAGASPPAPCPGQRDVAGVRARDDGRILRSGHLRKERGVGDERSAPPTRSARTDCAIVRRVRDLPDRPAAQLRSLERLQADARRRPGVDRVGINAQVKCERAEDRELGGRVDAVEIERRIDLRVAVRAGVGDRLVDVAADPIPSATARRCSWR